MANNVRPAPPKEPVANVLPHWKTLPLLLMEKPIS